MKRVTGGINYEELAPLLGEEAAQDAVATANGIGMYLEQNPMIATMTPRAMFVALALLYAQALRVCAIVSADPDASKAARESAEGTLALVQKIAEIAVKVPGKVTVPPAEPTMEEVLNALGLGNTKELIKQ